MGHTFVTSPFSSPYQFPALFTRIATQKEELHKMSAVNLQNVFIKLETVVQTSSTAQQFGGTEETFGRLANSHHFLLFTQCDPTLVLELGFIHNLQLHPPAPAGTLLYGSSKLRGGIGREL